MIKGTNSNCTIKNINISNTTATFFIVISSQIDQEEAIPFRFYLEDEDGTKNLISDTVYWIDRLSGYTDENINININKYKEIIFTVDITNQNDSELKGNKWYRKCRIVIINKNTKAILWRSDWQELLSKEIEVPKIKDLQIITDKNYNISLKLKYEYTSQEDFNYNNSNLYTTLSIISPMSNNILESIDIEDENELYSTIECVFTNQYKSDIIISIELKTNSGYTLSKKLINYKPTRINSYMYAFTNGQLKKVLNIYRIKRS